jgi:hypothetical protein
MNDATIGSVALTASLKNVWNDVVIDFAVLSAAALAAFVLALLIAQRMQRSLLTALGSLTNTANRVASTKDFSERAQNIPATKSASWPMPSTPCWSKSPTAIPNWPSIATTSKTRSTSGPRNCFSPRKRPRGQPCQECLPGQHEPRNPHPDERHHRRCRPARQQPLTPQQHSQLATLRGSADTLLFLLNDILDFRASKPAACSSNGCPSISAR